MDEESLSLTFNLSSYEAQQSHNVEGIALQPRDLEGTPLLASSVTFYATPSARI
jgi:hypothetical protein